MIHALFNPPRKFRMEQMTGFFMIGAALVFYLQPVSPVFTWLDQAFHFHFVMLWMELSLFIGGYVMAWIRRSRALVFFFLSAPIVFYGLLSMWYGFTLHATSFLPAYEIYGFWISLQMAHSAQEVIRIGRSDPT